MRCNITTKTKLHICLCEKTSLTNRFLHALDSYTIFSGGILISFLCLSQSFMADHPRSPTPDLYSILGISRNSSIKEIRKAYKFLVAKWHPDKNHANKTEAAAKFSAINEAYNEVIRNFFSIYIYILSVSNVFP